MPTIPMLPGTKSLEYGPGPVLDRERRPTVDHRGAIAAAGELGRAAQMPLTPDAPFVQAYARVGEAVTRAGGVLEAVALKRAEAQNDIDVADADTRMEAEQAEFEQWKTDNPDPRGWEQEWTRRAEEVRGEVMGKQNLAPAARDMIRRRSTAWAGRSRANVSRDATRMTFSLAKSAVLASADRAQAAGDEVGFGSALQDGQAKGYLFPHEAENMRQAFTAAQDMRAKQAAASQRESQRNGILSQIEQDPFEAMRMLDATDPDNGDRPTYLPDLDSADLATLRGAARAAQQRLRVEAEQLILDGIASGQIDAEAIEQNGSLVRLGEARIAELQQLRLKLAKQKEAALPMDWHEAGAVLREIEAYDPAQDKEGTQWASIYQRATLATAHDSPDAQQTDEVFRSRLDKVHPFLDHQEPQEAYGLMRTAEDFLAAYKKDGAFGPEQTQTSVGGKEVAAENTATTKKYVNWRHKIMNDLQRAAQREPEKFRDPSAVQAFIDAALRGAKLGSAVDALRPTPGAGAEGGHDASLFPLGSMPTDENIWNRAAH